MPDPVPPPAGAPQYKPTYFPVFSAAGSGAGRSLRAPDRAIALVLAVLFLALLSYTAYQQLRPLDPVLVPFANLNTGEETVVDLNGGRVNISATEYILFEKGGYHYRSGRTWFNVTPDIYERNDDGTADTRRVFGGGRHIERLVLDGNRFLEEGTLDEPSSLSFAYGIGLTDRMTLDAGGAAHRLPAGSGTVDLGETDDGGLCYSIYPGGYCTLPVAPPAITGRDGERYPARFVVDREAGTFRVEGGYGWEDYPLTYSVELH